MNIPIDHSANFCKNVMSDVVYHHVQYGISGADRHVWSAHIGSHAVHDNERDPRVVGLESVGDNERLCAAGDAARSGPSTGVVH